MTLFDSQHIGVVVIGRNEGERLHRCVQSVLHQATQIVYVDSDSSDTSVEYARSQNVAVVELDMSIPFSAGRARNEGFTYLLSKNPELEYIQFIDGDCELIDNWLYFASNYLTNNPTHAIVAGQRCERYPEKNIYNRLCDIEWNTPIGTTQSCGGDFLIRVSAFQQVTGFNPEIIAGEEPELCFRLRADGWFIYRYDQVMTLHDANITTFSQWWKRNIRCGHAYAQGYALHGQSKEKYCLRNVFRAWLWVLIIPTTILLLTITISPFALILFAMYPLQLFRIALSINKRFNKWQYSLPYALLNLLGKLPEIYGQLVFFKKKVLNKKHIIIEYK